MSLIDEALKRARHEASRQEAVKRDAARHDGPRPIPKLYAERQTSKAPLWAGIATGAAVALLGVVAWLLWGRAPSSPPVSVAAAEPPRVVSAAPSTVAAPAPLTAAVPTPRGEAVPRLPVPAVPQRQAAPASEVSRPAAPLAPPVAGAPAPTVTPPQREQPAKPTESPAAAPKPTPAPRAASSSAAPSATPQTYVREVALPGGGPHLRLGGIAYSEEAPIALINGAALGRGEVVEGYVVRRIDAAEVELEGPAGRVVLRLK